MHKNFLYQQTIKSPEGSTITAAGNIFLIDGKISSTYTFKNNYYFMFGDNRHDSKDSRYTGFVPEKNIIGKAVLVLFSTGEEGFMWKRFFRIIR